MYMHGDEITNEKEQKRQDTKPSGREKESEERQRANPPPVASPFL
jgi:hypothetical protein